MLKALGFIDAAHLLIVFCFNQRETRLTEAVDNICEGILKYNVHAERPGSLRYAKVA